MNEQLQNALAEAQHPLDDSRFNVCRLEIAEEGGRVHLRGTVLDELTLAAVLAHLRQQLPGIALSGDDIQVLRHPQPRLMAVTTNLTGLQREPSWLCLLYTSTDEEIGSIESRPIIEEMARQAARALVLELSLIHI